MNFSRLVLRCYPFKRETLEEIILKASIAPPKSKPPTQVRYLSSYLSKPEVKPGTIVVEYPYVDRHYLEEYSRYYATSLRPPPPKATRIHFFRSKFTSQGFSKLLEKAATESYDDVCKNIEEAYLGFIVVRPLPDAPIGRTILRTYEAMEPGRYYAIGSNDVHLAGLNLKIEGVPFQQQEQAVGACATTALWSSLSKIMRNNGQRPPTPFQVTEAATKHVVRDRMYPAVSGLSYTQILDAIREFGYSPRFIEPKGGDEVEFLLAIKCYIRSDMPVILQISYSEEMSDHAATIVGYREDDPHEPAKTIEHSLSTSNKLRVRGISRIYLHDDRLGPYARARWISVEERRSKINDKKKKESVVFPQLVYLPDEAGYNEFKVPAEVAAAMIPLYPKLRLSALDLIGVAGQLIPFMRKVLEEKYRDKLLVDARFCLSGNFIREILCSKIDPKRAVKFARNICLSRYIGVISYYVEDEIMSYAVCDTTDIKRDNPFALILAIIPTLEEHLAVFKDFAKSNMDGSLVV